MTLTDDIRQQIDSHKIISFDIFDTLLLRPYVKPTDLFLHLEKLEDAQGFAKARTDAEQKARKVHVEVEDITIDEIYDEIDSKYRNFKQKEMDLEFQVLQPNPEMKEVFNYAKKQGKKIIIVSDMYLPAKFLSDVLHKKGFSGFEKVYVSGEFKKKKGNGTLYQEVIKNENIRANDTLHIGDNKNSDYIIAQREGIDAFWYKQVIQRYLGQNEKAKLFLEKYPNNLEASVMIASFALHWLNNSNEEFWSRIGYEYGGPMVYAYMRWVEEQVLKEGIKEILFVARDGYSLQKVFNSFGHKDIKTHYVYAPRQVYQNCNIEQAIDNCCVLGALNYYRDKNKIIKKLTKNIKTEKEAALFIKDNLFLFTDMEAKERQEYKNYLESLEIKSDKIAIVDTITDNLSSQRLLTSFFSDKCLYGFYWNILTRGWKKYSDKYNMIQWGEKTPHSGIKCWDFVEYMITAPEPPITTINHQKVIYKEKLSNQEIKRETRYLNISSSIVLFAKGMILNFYSYNLIKEWSNLLFEKPTLQEQQNISTVKIAYDASHDLYRSMYDFPCNKPGVSNSNKNITKYSVLGIPLLKVKSINYYSSKFNDNCVKNKIRVLGLPLFKSIVSSWFYKLIFWGLPLVSTKSTNTKKSLHIFGIPLYKITNNMRKTTKQPENKTNILTKKDFYKMMVENNRVMERKLSTFALHQKTFPQFKGINKGKDVAIVATGPTLSEFKPIKNAIYIGVNRAVQFDKVHYNYYFIQDFSGATPSYIEDVFSYKNCIKFMGLTVENTESFRTIPEIYGEGGDVFRYRTDWEDIPCFKTQFAYDLSTTALGCGGTVVLPALQFALWTHPKRIYLVGCDTTTSGYFDNNQTNQNFLVPNELVERYREFADFSRQYYPDVEIISINPVGLKGIFNDEYQTKTV